MQITDLPTASTTQVTQDNPVVPMDINGVTYKADASTLSKAVQAINAEFIETTVAVNENIPANNHRYILLGAQSGYHAISVYMTDTSYTSPWLIISAPYITGTVYSTRILNLYTSANSISGTMHVVWRKDS